MNGKTAYDEKWIEIDGCRIRYIDTGGDGEPLLFLHGLGGALEGNEEVYPLFEKKYRVIAMDCTGTGESDKPDMDYNIDYLVDFTFQFADSLGIGKFFLTGGSQGGMQTLLCCRKSPDRIKKAAVYSPSGVWKPRPALSSLVKLLPPESVKIFMRITSLFWNSPTHPDFWTNRKEALEYVDSRELPGFGKHVMGCVASVMERDFRLDYAEVTTPLLIMWGEHDFGMPVTMARELHQIVAGSRLILVPKAGHNLPCEMPDLYAEKVMEFFEE